MHNWKVFRLLTVNLHPALSEWSERSLIAAANSVRVTFPILQAWSTSQLFFLNVFALQYKSWANIFKRFICLGFSWRYPGRNSLPSRRDFHRLNNNRVNNHHNHYHNNNDHYHDGEAHRRPVLYPLRPQGRARSLHAGREEVWGEAQGSGLQGIITLGHFSCSDFVWLWACGNF